MKMFNNKRALSTVVTTLIILVVSVLLATVVTYYAINVTTNRVQTEDLFLTKQHVWYNTTGQWAQAALVIVNTGGKDVVLDKVTVRGQDVNWTNTYYWRTSSVTISNDLEVSPDQLAGATASITVQGSARSFDQATTDLTVKSGWTLVIYAMNPGSISLNDVGIPVGITVYTANEPHYTETIIQAAQ